MSLYGYARVSSLDHDLSIQHAALKAAGCEVIRTEKASGARRDGRSELQVLLDFLRAGDTPTGSRAQSFVPPSLSPTMSSRRCLTSFPRPGRGCARCAR
jgi:hypothetical protein